MGPYYEHHAFVPATDREDAIACWKLIKHHFEPKPVKDTTIQDKIDAIEREYWINLMTECNGNVSEVTRRAGVNRKTVYNKLWKFNIISKEVKV